MYTTYCTQQYSSIPQSPDTAPQTDTSWPPPASSSLLWPCSHTERKDEKVFVNRDKHTVISGFLHWDFTSTLHHLRVDFEDLSYLK